MRRHWKATLALAFALALFMLPGASTPYWIQHTNFSLDPAISPEQYRPAADGSRPVPGNPPLPVQVQILPLPDGLPDSFLDITVRSIERWGLVPGSAIEVTALLPDPDETYDNDWMGRYADEDGRNTVEFITEDWPIWWGPLVIAVASPKLDKNGMILEADIFCNALHFIWEVFPQEGYFPDLARQYRVDVEAIVTHEMGHVLGLGHSQHPWASMYAGGGLANTMNRHLTTDDHHGLRALYPASSNDIAPPSIWGIHEDVFVETDCQMGKLQELMARLKYVERITPLPGPHDLIPTAKSDYPYCLYGSGFTQAISGMDLSQYGIAQNTVTGPAYVGPNFVKAKVWNGSGGFPALPVGAYDFTVTASSGATGILHQGLFIADAGNALPVAVIQPEMEKATAGTQVGLDGSGSSDQESPTLTYRWSVVESPPRAFGSLSSVSGPATYLYLPVPGLYVARLVVNDGTIDGIADQVVILATQPAGGSSHGSGFNPFGCAILPQDSDTSSLPVVILLLLPLAAAVLLRKIIAQTSGNRP